MAGYPYQSRWTDNRNRRSAGVRAFDAMQSAPYGMMMTQKPVILGTGGSTTIPIASYNVVKPQEADTVFAENKGPLSNVASIPWSDPFPAQVNVASGDELWIKLASPLWAFDWAGPGETARILMRINGVRFVLNLEGPQTTDSIGGTLNQGQAFIEIDHSYVTLDFDPATLTFNNKPASFGTLPGLFYEAEGNIDDVVESGDLESSDDCATVLIPNITESTRSLAALTGSSATVIRVSSAAPPLATEVGGKVLCGSGHADNVGLFRDVISVAGDDFTVDAFPQAVQNGDAFLLYRKIVGFRFSLEAGNSHFEFDPAFFDPFTGEGFTSYIPEVAMNAITDITLTKIVVL